MTYLLRYFLPFACSIYPVVSLYAVNLGQAHTGEAIGPALFLLLSGAVLFVCLRLATRSDEKAAVLFALLWVCIFSYGHVASTLATTAPPLARPRVLIPLFAGVLLALTVPVIRTHRNLRALGAIAVVVVASILGSSLVMITDFSLRSRSKAGDIAYPVVEIAANRVPEQLPDIYYVVLDRYASQRTLSDAYDYDNSEFIGRLRELGFIVSDSSCANYLMTAQSLAATLNLTHIDFLSKPMGRGSRDWSPLYRMLRSHRAGRFLKSQGYRFVHAGPLWSPSAVNPEADLNIRFGRFSEFSGILFRTTILDPILNRLGFRSSDAEQFHRVNYQFDRIGDIRGDSQPVFVFAHFLLPHAPFVFDEECRFVGDGIAGPRTRAERYVAQVSCANRKVLDFIERVTTRRNGSLPIIVVQADEGPYFERSIPLTFDWSEATTEELRWKMGILSAIYMPGGEELLYDGLTPVNTFRVIFRHLFGSDLPLLPDRSLVFRDLYHLYDFQDVSARLPGTNAGP